ncbi:TPA: HNH endonuclease [Streptococcus suis]|nr:HNH endonuclease [Streptococcus suis]
MEYILSNMYDEFILDDISNKIGIFPIANSDDLAEHLIRYVRRHYNVYNSYVNPKISNFYRKHKKFTRFILISISVFCSPKNINEMLSDYAFNERLKWELEHIIPQNQCHNKFNSENTKLKNRIGNIALLTKETNSQIKNESFSKKCEAIKVCEKELLVNKAFNQPKINFSKSDICKREKEINTHIFEIFFKDEGKLLKTKLKEHCNGIPQMKWICFVS